MNSRVGRGMTISPYKILFGRTRRDGYEDNRLPPNLLQILTNEEGVKASLDRNNMSTEEGLRESIMEAQAKVHAGSKCVSILLLNISPSLQDMTHLEHYTRSDDEPENVPSKKPEKKTLASSPFLLRKDTKKMTKAQRASRNQDTSSDSDFEAEEAPLQKARSMSMLPKKLVVRTKVKSVNVEDDAWRMYSHPTLGRDCEVPRFRPHNGDPTSRRIQKSRHHDLLTGFVKKFLSVGDVYNANNLVWHLDANNRQGMRSIQLFTKSKLELVHKALPRILLSSGKPGVEIRPGSHQ
jgi:hypothetical protein